MEILEQISTHAVTDYDFMFHVGTKLAVTIDHDAGDTIEELSDRYVINTVEKPSLLNPEEKLDASSVEVFKAQLAVVAKIKRKQRMPTVEEMFAQKQLIHAMAKGIQ